MNCTELAALLDRELRLSAFRDVSNNGLQIENEGPITRVATAVDASLETFEAAAAQGAQMLIVHHGLSWGDSLARITGANRRLLAAAFRHNLALYAAHLIVRTHAIQTDLKHRFLVMFPQKAQQRCVQQHAVCDDLVD